MDDRRWPGRGAVPTWQLHSLWRTPTEDVSGRTSCGPSSLMTSSDSALICPDLKLPARQSEVIRAARQDGSLYLLRGLPWRACRARGGQSPWWLGPLPLAVVYNLLHGLEHNSPQNTQKRPRNARRNAPSEIGPTP